MARNNLRKDCRINFAPETASRIKPLPISFHPPRGGSDSLFPSDFLYSPASLPLNIFLRLFIFNFPARLIVSLRFFLIPSPLLSLSPSLFSLRRKEERNSRQTNRRRILKAEWRLNLLSFLFWGHGNGEKRCSYIHIHVYRGAWFRDTSEWIRPNCSPVSFQDTDTLYQNIARNERRTESKK